MQPITLEITLDLDKFVSRYHGLSRDPEADIPDLPPTVEDVILDQAGRILADKALSTATIKDPYDSIARRIKTIRDEQIHEALRPIIAEAIAKPTIRTNSFGETIGKEEVTLREVIISEARAALTKAQPDNFRNPKGSILQQIIATEVASVLRKELTEAIAEAKTQAKAAVAAEAGRIIAAAMEKK